MVDNKQCIVIFPVYTSITESERYFFEQAIRMTSGFRHVFIAPRSMHLDDSFGDLRALDVICFDEFYFKDIVGYNLLMLSREFYETFTDYEYMLIHQSDVYLFKPELKFWCEKGYDYIGAPWLKPKKIRRGIFYQKLIDIFPKLYPSEKKKLHECYNAVGNGGLSLRRINSFLTIFELPDSSKILNVYREKLLTNSLYNEDIFWSIEAPRMLKYFSKPLWKEAMAFAVETHCYYAYRLLGEKLPFGCHAPSVYEPEFWQNHIPSFKIC
ncbi:DUF5672 family protein [Dysgonomonas sp. ZJ279]|uniref:DUF5672 family protein n=1 Tax=Dysgonomonas sp. ZJ279 TaxID=2709796 RepID=UPI0013EAC430|nr:DUF5672 family protein [Dysgonomonas sp. ZJ279]